MQFNSNSSTYSNKQNQKPSCYFCDLGPSPCPSHAKALSSSSQSKESFTIKSTFSNIPQQQQSQAGIGYSSSFVQSKESSINKPTGSYAPQQQNQVGTVYASSSSQNRESFPSKPPSSNTQQEQNHSGTVYSSSLAQSQESFTKKPTGSYTPQQQKQAGTVYSSSFLSLQNRESFPSKPPTSSAQQQQSQAEAFYSSLSVKSKEIFTNPLASSYNPQLFSQAEHQQIHSISIPAGVKNRCNSCSKKEALRICLDCSKICCETCALDIHKSHLLLKLNEVPEKIQNKKNELKEIMKTLETSIREEGPVSQALKIEEDKLMKQVGSFFEKCYNLLQKQEEVAKIQIRNKFQEISAEYQRNAQNNSSNKNYAQGWIAEAKKLLLDIENKSLGSLEGLYKHEELYKRDPSKFKDSLDKDAFENILNQIQVKCNDDLLKTLKKEKAILMNIKSNQPTNHYQASSEIEAVRKSVADVLQQGISQNPNQQNNASSIRNPSANPNNHAASERRQTNPSTKIDITQDFKKAFFRKLEIRVDTEGPNHILLESISQKNSHISGFRNDEDMRLFSQILQEDRLQEPCKKVSCLTLDCSNFTQAGIASLIEVFKKLKELKEIHLSFNMASGFSPLDTKELFKEVSKLASLKTLSLKFPGWARLTGNAFTPFLSNICGNSANSHLKTLILDFSECNQLDLAGISEGLNFPIKLSPLETLLIRFKGCVNLKYDEKVLRNITEKCVTSNLKKIKLDFTECINLPVTGSKWVMTSKHGKQMKFFKNQK